MHRRSEHSTIAPTHPSPPSKTRSPAKTAASSLSQAWQASAKVRSPVTSSPKFKLNSIASSGAVSAPPHPSKQPSKILFNFSQINTPPPPPHPGGGKRGVAPPPYPRGAAGAVV